MVGYSSHLLTIITLWAFLYPFYIPLLDHHFIERQTNHNHIYLGEVQPNHQHTYQDPDHHQHQPLSETTPSLSQNHHLNLVTQPTSNILYISAQRASPTAFLASAFAVINHAYLPRQFNAHQQPTGKVTQAIFFWQSVFIPPPEKPPQSLPFSFK